MQTRACPKCSTPWYSSGWQGPARLRCSCGAALNLAEAQLDRELVAEATELAQEIIQQFSPSESGK